MALLGISILIASLSYLIYKRLPYQLISPRRYDSPRDVDSSNAQIPIIVTDDDRIPDRPTEKKEKRKKPGEEDEDRRIMPPPALPPIIRRPPKTGDQLGNGPLFANGAASVMGTPSIKPPPQPSPSRSIMSPPPLPRLPKKTSLTSSPTQTRINLQPRPTSSSLSPSSLRPTPTKAPSKQRKAVILSPGRSPLDWARLQNTANINLRGLPAHMTQLILVPPSVLARHNKRDDAWAAFGGRVYNITPYLEFHPGGVGELMRAAGRDGTALFAEVHPWVSWETMLRACEVGVLVDEPVVVGDGQGEGEGGRWEEMD